MMNGNSYSYLLIQGIPLLGSAIIGLGLILFAYSLASPTV